ncbi:Flp family type IVb pilin [Marinobacter panjinensis]|uniref:Flp family type IVb pilin n=1 Tax=Marinobacter panjinensis TaxID=2576384 RepID=A0A4V6CXY6_9GAMM|nr:Flp family type IVb pilin [Marinobacter panjinensis]TKV69245.1 Flp family type IVb pilin [Marinobacter panjinensis]
MKNLKEKVVQFLRDEEGLELSEYAVAGALIVLGAVTAFTLLGDNIALVIDGIADTIVAPTP